MLRCLAKLLKCKLIFKFNLYICHIILIVFIKLNQNDYKYWDDNAVYLLLWLSSQLENRHVVGKASAVELRVLPHTRNLVIIRELEKVSEILDYNISLMRIIPDLVLKTFSVTWGYSSLEFGPTSFGSQSPEYSAPSLHSMVFPSFWSIWQLQIALLKALVHCCYYISLIIQIIYWFT